MRDDPELYFRLNRSILFFKNNIIPLVSLRVTKKQKDCSDFFKKFHKIPLNVSFSRKWESDASSRSEILI